MIVVFFDVIWAHKSVSSSMLFNLYSREEVLCVSAESVTPNKPRCAHEDMLCQRSFLCHVVQKRKQLSATTLAQVKLSPLSKTSV